MYTPGTILRLAREERKISLADTKLIIKIRESALHAMETDQFERFPVSYMTTFLPEYAAFLGVPPEKLAESMKIHFPEQAVLSNTLTAQALRNIANAQAFRDNSSLLKQTQHFVAKNSKKVVATTMVCIVAFFALISGVASIGADMMRSVLSKAIVETPSEMRGTPFSELSLKNNEDTKTRSLAYSETASERTKSSTINDVARLNDEKIAAHQREQELQDEMRNSNANMKVISLAAIVPLQREMQSAIENGFEYIMHDEKADARMRRKSTPLGSVSMLAAKSRLEADAKEKADVSKEMYFSPDSDEDEENETVPTASEASIEASLNALRKNADAASARISLIMQTRTAAQGSAFMLVPKTEINHHAEMRRFSGNAPTIEIVQLQAVQSMTITGISIHQPQAFTPVQIPQEAFSLHNIDANLAQN